METLITSSNLKGDAFFGLHSDALLSVSDQDVWNFRLRWICFCQRTSWVSGYNANDVVPSRQGNDLSEVYLTSTHRLSGDSL